MRPFLLTIAALIAMNLVPRPLAAEERSVTVISAASRQAAVAAGSLAVVLGEGFIEEPVSIEQGQTANPPESLAGIRVLFNGVPARLIHVTPEEIYCVLPENLALGEAQVHVVEGSDRVLGAGTARIEETSPGLFSEDNSGMGYGRIYDAATGAPGPFRVRRKSGAGADEETRILLAATGLRALAGAGAGPQIPGQTQPSVVVKFLRYHGISNNIVIPDEVTPASDYAGLEHIVVRLPAELNGMKGVFVLVQAAGKVSNAVALDVLQEAAPVVLSADPPEFAPGQVLRITGRGFVGSTDGRDRILLASSNGAAAAVLPFGVVRKPFEAIELSVIVPPLADVSGKEWWEGPVNLCVETDGLTGCAAGSYRMAKAPPPSGAPGSALIALLEQAFDSAADAGSDPTIKERILSMKTKASGYLRAKVEAALAGAPEKITLDLADGQLVEAAFDQNTIRRLETVLQNGRTVLEEALTLKAHQAGAESRAASDYEEEKRLREVHRSFNWHKQAAETIARLLFSVAAPAVAACSPPEPACQSAAAALAAAAPAYAAMSLANMASMVAIQAQPDTLQQLQVSPLAVVLREGEQSEFDVKGRFASALDVSQDVETAARTAAAKAMASMISSGVFGLPAGHVFEAAVAGPLADYMAELQSTLGLEELMTGAPPSTQREVGLSWETVWCTCIRGSSPSPGATFFLGSWEVRGFLGMSAPEFCHFMPAGNVLATPTAATPVSASVHVLGQRCRVHQFPEPLFDRLLWISPPNQAGDSVVLGDMSSKPQVWRELFNTLMIPSFENQTFCGRIILTPGCSAEVYVPTSVEMGGMFSGFLVFDPLTGMPFPGGIIPRSRIGPGLVPLRVRYTQGCGN